MRSRQEEFGGEEWATRLLRILTLLIIASSVAAGQEPNCTELTLRVLTSGHTVATPVWRVYVQNRSHHALTARMPSQGIRWKIEQAGKNGWNEALTGGIGPGKASKGATPAPEVDFHTIRGGEQSLVAEFDLRRDIPEEEALKLTGRYRITFEQDVALDRASDKTCKLVAKPKLFRFEPKK